MPQDGLLALRAFLYAFPTESPPILGQQVTLTDGNGSNAAARIDLLVERGMVDTPIPECDLVAKGVVDAAARGWSMDRTGQFISDRAGETAIDRSTLEALINEPGEYLTFTCTPWGSGRRTGIDRDLDGVLDGDE